MFGEIGVDGTADISTQARPCLNREVQEFDADSQPCATVAHDSRTVDFSPFTGQEEPQLEHSAEAARQVRLNIRATLTDVPERRPRRTSRDLDDNPCTKLRADMASSFVSHGLLRRGYRGAHQSPTDKRACDSF